MSDQQKPEQQHDEPVEDLDPDEEVLEQVRGGRGALNTKGGGPGGPIKPGWDLGKNPKL